MSSVFLFGAGASHGSVDCLPSPPPLGTELFQELRREGGIAGTMEDALADLFMKDFEMGMAEFFLHRNVDVVTFLREIALFFLAFDPGPGNLYRRLVRLLVETRTHAVLATRNYELLIERAACIEGFKVTYHGLPVPAMNFSVLKIHGSCNFLPMMEPHQLTGIRFDIGESGAAILSADVRPGNTEDVRKFLREEDSVAPSISMYARGKRVLFCPQFVADQQEAFRREVKNARRVFVVGLRVNPEDEHIWGPLGSTEASLFYVGGDGGDFEKWRKVERRRTGCVLASTFAAAVPLIETQLRR